MGCLVAECDELGAVCWEWQAADGVMGRSRFEGGARGPNPTDRAKPGTKKSVLVEQTGGPLEHKQAVHNIVAGLAKEAGIRRPKQLADEFMLLIDGAISHALLEASPKPAMRAKRLATLALEDHLAEHG